MVTFVELVLQGLSFKKYTGLFDENKKPICNGKNKDLLKFPSNSADAYFLTCLFDCSLINFVSFSHD